VSGLTFAHDFLLAGPCRRITKHSREQPIAAAIDGNFVATGNTSAVATGLCRFIR
jgi:hypothetical protein